MHVMVPLELSCNYPVFLGSGMIVHGHVCGVVGEAFEEPMGELPLFFNGDALRGEELMPIDGLVDANSAQTVQSVQFDVWGEDMHGVVSVRDWDEEIKDISFIFFIALWPPTLSLPLCVPLVHVFLPVFIGCFQVSCAHLTLCQIFSSLFECFELFLIVMANLLIFVCNSCQSLCDEEKLLPSR